jgi:hypothetical protein
MVLTLEQKYGPSGVKGTKGEKLFYEYAVRVYDEVHWNYFNMKDQGQGVDFRFKKNNWKFLYSADVKANMTGSYSNLKYNGRFAVEASPYGWLKNKRKKSNRIIHLDIENLYYLEYSRDLMKEYLLDINKELIWFNTNDSILKDLNVKHFSIKNKLKFPIVATNYKEVAI